MKRFSSQILLEKGILQKENKKPPKEVILEKDKIVVLKDAGTLEIPLSSVRGQILYERLTVGISEHTQPLYV
ncbi:MAG: hypothetical protein GXO04_04705 [Aquificae bacterium]|nr:hypothetical protein [Aquificota bacterium]